MKTLWQDLRYGARTFIKKPGFTTHDLWKRRFGGDPNVLGRKLTLDAAPFYVIYGVTPPGFNFPGMAHD